MGGYGGGGPFVMNHDHIIPCDVVVQSICKKVIEISNKKRKKKENILGLVCVIFLMSTTS
jgi:hypothetical protein